VPSQPHHGGRAYFSGFELDVRTGELRHEGQMTARLSEQPLQILILLLSSPGELVSREELQKQLWPNDTIVEFGHSINAAMNRLRAALGDSAKEPQFIETLTRKGYRWKGSVEWRNRPDRAATIPSQAERMQGSPLRILLVSAVLLLGACAVFYSSPRKAAPRERILGDWRQRQLTVNSAENPVTGGAISPDGKYFAFTDFNGMHIRGMDGGTVVNLADPDVYQRSRPNWEIGYWLPDSQHFFAIAEFPLQPTALWVLSIAGEPSRKLAEGADPWGVSPEGMVALAENDGHEIRAVDLRGGTPTLLVQGGNTSRFRAIHWSPDGSRLSYIRNVSVNAHNESHIEILDRKTGRSWELASGPALAAVSELEEDYQDLIWLSADRLIFVGGTPDLHGLSCNLWQIKLDPQSATAVSPPEQITDWAGYCVTNLSKTADGKKLAFTRSSDLMNVFVADYDQQGRRVATPRRLTLSEDLSSSMSWSEDASALYFRSNRLGKWGVFKQPLDSSQAAPLVTVGNQVTDLSLTPDQKWVLYLRHDSTGAQETDRLERVAAAGGAEQELLLDKNLSIACGASARGVCVLAQVPSVDNKIVFYRLDALRGRSERLAEVKEPDANEFRWSLSPDGMHAAVYEPYSGQFDLVSLSDASVQRVSISPSAHLRTLTWSTTGDGFFACSAIRQGAELLFVERSGKARKLWQLDGFRTYLRALPSPDGNHLAIDGSAKNANLWVLEDF